MTILVMVISWSMSWGFSSLKLAVLSALYGLTWIWWGSSESGNLVKYSSLTAMSRTGMTS